MPAIMPAVAFQRLAALPTILPRRQTNPTERRAAVHCSHGPRGAPENRPVERNLRGPHLSTCP